MAVVLNRAHSRFFKNGLSNNWTLNRLRHHSMLGKARELRSPIGDLMSLLTPPTLMLQRTAIRLDSREEAPATELHTGFTWTQATSTILVRFRDLVSLKSDCPCDRKGIGY